MRNNLLILNKHIPVHAINVYNHSASHTSTSIKQSFQERYTSRKNDISAKSFTKRSAPFRRKVEFPDQWATL